MNRPPFLAAAALSMAVISSVLSAQSPEPANTHPPAQPSPAAAHPALAHEPVTPSLLAPHKVEYPSPPTEGIFVSDSAVVLTIDEQRAVNKSAALVKDVTGLPVMVVTISSLEIMGNKPEVTINDYGREVFKHWSLSSARDDRAVLLLLSRNDRQACVIMGAGWGTAQDAFKHRVEAVTLVPTATAGNAYASGLTRAISEVNVMFTQAGYPKEMLHATDSPGSLTPGGIAPTTPLPVAPPPATTIGWVAWLGIGLVVVIGLVLAAVFTRGKAG